MAEAGGRLSNPISTMRGQIMPTTFLVAIPDFQTFCHLPVRHPCGNHIGSRYCKSENIFSFNES